MTNRFVTELVLRYQDTDTQLRATPVSLLGMMQEAAILHSEQLGRGIAWLSKRNLSWVLAQSRTKIFHCPVWPARLQVTTWPSEMGHYLSRREFVLTDQSKKPCIVASSLWAFVDLQTRKICRIPEELKSIYALDKEMARPGPFRRPRLCETPHHRDQFLVRRFDSDYNGHVNNLRYLDWMLESIPEDIWNHFGLSEFNIRFQKEVMPGENICTQMEKRPEDQEQGLRHFSHQIDSATTSESLALAESVWRRL